MTKNLTTMLAGETLTMSSREIAELVEKRHDNVKRTIEMLVDRGVITLPQIEEVSFKDSIGKTQRVSIYNLCKRDTFVVVARLSPEFTARVVDRWQELESQQTKPQLPDFSNPVVMAREFSKMSLAYADEYEKRVEAEKVADEAIRTRAMIGSKREAQAMNLASQAAKKVKKLEAELDRSNEYATIKKMENIFNQKFSWRKLKAVSEDLDIEVQQIPDKNYGSVNSYHRMVWLEAYGLDINTSKAEAQKLILLEKLNALFVD